MSKTTARRCSVVARFAFVFVAVILYDPERWGRRPSLPPRPQGASSVDPQGCCPRPPPLRWLSMQPSLLFIRLLSSHPRVFTTASARDRSRSTTERNAQHPHLASPSALFLSSPSAPPNAASWPSSNRKQILFCRSRSATVKASIARTTEFCAEASGGWCYAFLAGWRVN